MDTSITQNPAARLTLKRDTHTKEELQAIHKKMGMLALRRRRIRTGGAGFAELRNGTVHFVPLALRRKRFPYAG